MSTLSYYAISLPLPSGRRSRHRYLCSRHLDKILQHAGHKNSISTCPAPPPPDEHRLREFGIKTGNCRQKFIQTGCLTKGFSCTPSDLPLTIHELSNGRRCNSEHPRTVHWGIPRTAAPGNDDCSAGARCGEDLEDGGGWRPSGGWNFTIQEVN